MTADFKKYDNAITFRQALEDRIKNVARQRAIPLDRLRRQITFDRFLARLFDANKQNQQWLLKGGYALEFRFHNLARTTKDIDFTIPHMKDPDENAIREILQAEATFKRRGTHDIPEDLEAPPDTGGDTYAGMAQDCGVEKKTMDKICLLKGTLNPQRLTISLSSFFLSK